ncbi:MAG: hypothetical protein A2666_04585 [Parcubacteria group bacterium RIFCSPHIGHO2_01_FULL_47_10b]|nr:MAG: hypothetical protein A2666_04585 [Parcubacteria group bacterium RIFCSPHIGHO2_01_FULL_47_10b]
MNSTLQIRIDTKTKNAARKIFEDLGLDTSSAIKLYFRQVINHNGIPFRLITENGFTPEKEQRILAETADTIRDNKSYSSVDDMIHDVLND